MLLAFFAANSAICFLTEPGGLEYFRPRRSTQKKQGILPHKLILETAATVLSRQQQSGSTFHSSSAAAAAAATD